MAEDAPEPLSARRQVQGRLDRAVVLTERVDGVRLGLGRIVRASHLQIERQSGLNPRRAFRGVRTSSATRQLRGINSKRDAAPSVARGDCSAMHYSRSPLLQWLGYVAERTCD
jgi:hypothetical protein